MCDATHHHLREKREQNCVFVYTQCEIAEKNISQARKKEKRFHLVFFLLQIELIEMEIRKWAWEIHTIGNGMIVCKVYASQLWQLILQFDAIYNAIEFEINVLLFYDCFCYFSCVSVYVSIYFSKQKGVDLHYIRCMCMLYIWSIHRSFFFFKS